MVKVNEKCPKLKRLIYMFWKKIRGFTENSYEELLSKIDQFLLSKRYQRKLRRETRITVLLVIKEDITQMNAVIDKRNNC